MKCVNDLNLKTIFSAVNYYIFFKMEDEECLPENSNLKLYLQNLGFTDIPVTKITPRDPSRLYFEVSKPVTNSLETIDEDVVDQISIIVSTQMLFEEDIAKVEKLLSSFKVVKTEMLKSMFRDSFGVAVMFLGLCLFWVIGYYAFLIVSTFYAFTAAKYLSRKHFNRSRIKKLTSILESNFILLKKTVKFIQENRSLEASACRNNSFEFVGGFDSYNNFKSDFVLSMNEMINVLVKSTQKLIIKIPLYDYIEHPDSYLCNNLKQNYESLNISNLYQVYLLLQSEFLQRLIFSLIPNIKLSMKDGFCELNKILTETCVSLLKLKNKFNKKFKFIFLNGIYSSKSCIKFKLPFKQNSDNKYTNEFILNIHETSNTFQKLLLQCRILEERLTSDNISKFIEQELVKMQESLKTCQQNITDSLILFKKANFMSDSPEVRNEVKVQDEKEIKCFNEESNKVIVGYSDFDPKIEDEIFEACFNNENCVPNSSHVDAWDLEEKLMKKQKKEFCKNVMNELKIKLKEKAKYWKKRERELLKKKGIIDVDEYEETETSDQEREVEDIVDNLDIQEPSECQNIFKNYESNNKSEFKNFEDDLPTEKSEIPLEYQAHCVNSQENCTFKSGITNEENTCNSPKESLKSDLKFENFNQSFNKNFLNDLNQARQKIFKSCTANEESFYASGEDSSSEDSQSL